MKHDHTIKDLQVSVEALENSWECVIEALYGDTNRNIGLAEVVRDTLALREVEEERDMLADENKQMAEYLIYLNYSNKIPLERDGFGWLLHDKEVYGECTKPI